MLSSGSCVAAKVTRVEWCLDAACCRIAIDPLGACSSSQHYRLSLLQLVSFLFFLFHLVEAAVCLSKFHVSQVANPTVPIFGTSRTRYNRTKGDRQHHRFGRPCLVELTRQRSSGLSHHSYPSASQANRSEGSGCQALDIAAPYSTRLGGDNSSLS